MVATRSPAESSSRPGSKLRLLLRVSSVSVENRGASRFYLASCFLEYSRADSLPRPLNFFSLVRSQRKVTAQRSMTFLSAEKSSDAPQLFMGLMNLAGVRTYAPLKVRLQRWGKTTHSFHKIPFPVNRANVKTAVVTLGTGDLPSIVKYIYTEFEVPEPTTSSVTQLANYSQIGWKSDREKKEKLAQFVFVFAKKLG
ncbi:hypothetical protein TNCV_667971 [Trichonephila clavipes]|nr:hypothetical protein TNCV_667971 [Trichonephila clavipes]